MQAQVTDEYLRDLRQRQRDNAASGKPWVAPLSFARCYWSEATGKEGRDDEPPPGATVCLDSLRENFLECSCYFPINAPPPGSTGGV